MICRDYDCYIKKLVANLLVDPGVQQLYTRVYKPCTWGCTKSVHPGGDENCSLANKSQKRAYEKPYIQAINSYILVRNHCKKVGDTW